MREKDVGNGRLVLDGAHALPAGDVPHSDVTVVRATDEQCAVD